VYSLTEVRIMYELVHENATTASALADLLGVNHGYLSRILKRFKSLGFIERSRSLTDGRELLLKLTSRGRKVYALLNERANSEVERLLKGLATEDIRKLLAAMDAIRGLLGGSRPESGTRLVSPDKETTNGGSDSHSYSLRDQSM